MKRQVISIFLVILLSSLASASFTVGNLSHSIEDQYGVNETLIGWINISLDKEDADSRIMDGLGNYIELLEIIEKNSGYEYDCSTQECSPDYSASSGGTTISLTLGENESSMIGFQLFGSIKGVDSISFTIENSSVSSCINPLKVDIFDDGSIDIAANQSSLEICSESKDYGCFNINDPVEEYNLGRILYCQKTMLEEAPGYRVGAWVKKSGSGSADLVIFLHDGDSDVAYCDLPEASSSGGELYCDLDFLIESPKEYYVCVFADEAGIYKIRANENPEEKCGFYGTPPKEATSAYQIYVEKRKFGPIPEIVINDFLPNGENLASLIENYIISKYGGLSCQEGCVVPIEITSGVNQEITFKGLDLAYERTSGQVSSDKFFDVIESPTKISSDFQKLYLDKGVFKIFGDYGKVDYFIKLETNTIFTDEIEIVEKAVINDITPKITSLGKPTLFKVNVKKPEGTNITEYKWETDDEIKTTTNNSVTLTLTSLGNNNMNVSAKDSEDQISKKTFIIYVYSPEEEIEKKISNLKSKVSELKGKIEHYPQFQKESISKALNLEEVEDILNSTEKKYENATTEEEFLEIIQELRGIELPDSVSTTKTSAGVTFIPDIENIDSGIVSLAGGGTYESEYEEEYRDAILLWYYDNMDIKVGYDEISLTDQGKTELLLTVFELDIQGDLSLEPYLLMEDMLDLKFMKDYGQEEIDGYYYIQLLSGQEKITFSTTEDISFMNLPIFVSPSLSDLEIQKPPIIGEPEGPNWIYFILIVIFIFIIAVVVYAILQKWYEIKYETYLFRNRNHLFNLMNYINIQKIHGVSDGEIIKKLRKSRWKGEQITYAMRKYEGKRTGMYELPFLKFFKRKPKKLPPKTGVMPPPSMPPPLGPGGPIGPMPRRRI